MWGSKLDTFEWVLLIVFGPIGLLVWVSYIDNKRLPEFSLWRACVIIIGATLVLPAVLAGATFAWMEHNLSLGELRRYSKIIGPAGGGVALFSGFISHAIVTGNTDVN